MNDDLRNGLVVTLEKRRWTHLDAERAAERVGRSYTRAEGPWKAWHTHDGDGPDYYRVARRESEVSVYESLLKGLGEDVANALNEVERR